MPKFNPKPCKICGTLFTLTGPCAFYCATCLPEVNRKRAIERNKRYRLKKGCLVGVGKGGAPHSGEKNPMWKGGVCGPFKTHREEMRRTIKHCEWCGKDLTEATRYEWCVHHIDHNRKNNSRSNLVMLCKRCHQIHHDCASKLNVKPEGATTMCSKAETAPGIQNG